MQTVICPCLYGTNASLTRIKLYLRLLANPSAGSAD